MCPPSAPSVLRPFVTRFLCMLRLLHFLSSVSCPVGAYRCAPYLAAFGNFVCKNTFDYMETCTLGAHVCNISHSYAHAHAREGLMCRKMCPLNLIPMWGVFFEKKDRVLIFLGAHQMCPPLVRVVCAATTRFARKHRVPRTLTSDIPMTRAALNRRTV